MHVVPQNEANELLETLWALYEPFRQLRDVAPPPDRITALQRQYAGEAARDIAAGFVDRRVRLPIVVADVGAQSIESNIRISESRSYYGEFGDYMGQETHSVFVVSMRAVFDAEFHRRAVALCRADAVVLEGSITSARAKIRENARPSKYKSEYAEGGRSREPFFHYYPELEIEVAVSGLTRTSPPDHEVLYQAFVHKNKPQAQLIAEAKAREVAAKATEERKTRAGVSGAAGFVAGLVAGIVLGPWAAFAIFVFPLLLFLQFGTDDNAYPMSESAFRMGAIALSLGGITSCFVS